MGNTIEDGGVRFEQVKDTWQVLDYDYGMEVGTIVLEEGPGWTFKPASSFLDLSHLEKLAKFIRNLPDPEES